MYQLINKDEYGGANIVASSQSLEEVVQKAYKSITNDNVNNALTFDDMMNDWETYWVEILDEDGNATLEAVFGGPDRGANFVYHMHDGVAEKKYLDEVDVPMRFYIGTDNGRKLYASKVVRGRPGEREPISDLNDMMLRDKGYYYIKVI